MSELTVFARSLRKRSTPHEVMLWRHLRAKRFEHYKFRRQQPIGRYIVDFVCHEKALIVELDGGHHSEQLDGDRTRSDWLKLQGFRILRFWNNELDSNMDDVLTMIDASLSPSPQPSPIKGEGANQAAQ